MSNISQIRNGPRRALGIINNNSTPMKESSGVIKGGASAVDEVHSIKKEKQSTSSLFTMTTRSGKKREASLKEADEKETAEMSSPSKMSKTAAALQMPKAAMAPLKGEEVGEESAAMEIFRPLPEMDEAFWDEMEDLLEIKLANPIVGSEDDFDANSYDGDEQNNEGKEVVGDV